MDIIVTVPKSRWNDDDREDSNKIAFWSLKRKPTKLTVGDRVHFVKRGVVDYSMRVIDIRPGSDTCTTTGKTWNNSWLIYLDDYQEADKTPMKGFQGFRYYDRGDT